MKYINKEITCEGNFKPNCWVVRSMHIDCYKDTMPLVSGQIVPGNYDQKADVDLLGFNNVSGWLNGKKALYDDNVDVNNIETLDPYSGMVSETFVQVLADAQFVSGSVMDDTSMQYLSCTLVSDTYGYSASCWVISDMYIKLYSEMADVVGELSGDPDNFSQYAVVDLNGYESKDAWLSGDISKFSRRVKVTNIESLTGVYPEMVTETLNQILSSDTFSSGTVLST